ncbi:hypothetical protein [Actinomadura chibensis]|uniref:DUF4878 domain-containing protein n=1 Tax=Actinomadura chibensis TaxID=392828 RepID=A0A5D0NY05_9ACTN|nr:hypothetical protein [Actinomadura chibensis]TYB48891.1 hypothetical protein FXF69_06985 [Actinomadura chibensis]
MASKVRRSALWLILAVGALVIVVAALAVWLWPDKGGASNPRAIARSYVQTLNDRDSDGLKKLYYPSDRSQAKNEINALLSKYGGKKIRVTRMDVVQEFGPDMAQVKIIGTSNAGPYTEALDTAKRDGAWYLITNPT